MTSRTLLLFMLALALLLFGLAVLQGAAIALALPLLLYAGVAFWQRAPALKLSASREFSADKLVSGDIVTVTLTVTNNGAALRAVRIDDLLPAGLALLEGDTHVVTALEHGASVALVYSVRGGRGEYRFHQAGAVAQDDFLLSAQTQQVPAPGLLLIKPVSLLLRPLTIRPPRTRGFAGPIPARLGGSGVDFSSLREYQMGDRLRAINWRVTARAQTRNERGIYTNVFEQERIADVGLILDAREALDLHTIRGSLFDQSVQATAALAESFLRAGDRVGLLVYGAGISSVFPGYGRVQRERILRTLGRTAPGRHFVFENLEHLPARFFAPQSQIVFVGPLNGPDVPTLLRLRAHGFSVMVISPDPIAFETPDMPPSHNQELAGRIARAERAHILQQLRRAGMQVVDWDVSQPFDTVVRDALARQPALRSGQVRLA